MSNHKSKSDRTQDFENRPSMYETEGSFEFRLNNAISKWDDVESMLHNIGGIQWSLLLQRDVSDDVEVLSLFLSCHGHKENFMWSCTANFTLELVSTVPSSNLTFSETGFTFSAKDDNDGSYGIENWSNVIDAEKGFLVNDTLTFCAVITIVQSVGFTRKLISTFDENLYSDVIINVGNRKVYANKGILALHSPFFGTLFYGAFNETGKDEVNLSEVNYDEFIEFLRAIYPERKCVDSTNVEVLLKLADRFECPVVLADCEKHLLSEENTLTISKNLFYADKYRLVEVMEKYMAKLLKPIDFRNLTEQEECKDYSNELLRMLLSRIPA